MHVAVDDRCARDGALAQQDRGRDRDVVEHAVAFAAIAERVMRPAGEVGGNLYIGSRSDHLAGRRERRSNRAPRSLDHHLRPRKADPPLRFRRQRAARDRVDVRRHREPAAGRPTRSRRGHAGRPRRARPASTSRSRSSRYFAHRKPMLVRQRQDERVRVERFHGTRTFDARVLSHGARENNRCACRRRTAASHRRRFPVAARANDAREARMGAEARRSPPARADARAARPRRHVRRDPDRAGRRRARTPACCSCTTKATARCAATASSRSRRSRSSAGC